VVRSGGHSFPGLSVADDAFLIDLSLMTPCSSSLFVQNIR